MRINMPAGFSSPYGELVAYPSADGSIFVGMIGDGPRQDDFLFHLWRQFPDGRTQWIDLGQPMFHGHLMLTPDGLYACGFYDIGGKNRELHFFKVPGYVPMGGQVPSQPVFIPQPQAAVDSSARVTADTARSLAQTAKDRVDALKKQVDDHFKNHPSAAPATGGVSEARVREIAAEVAWAKGRDAFYAIAQEAKGDQNHWLRAFIREVTPAQAPVQPAPQQPAPAPEVDLDALVEKVVAALVERLKS